MLYIEALHAGYGPVPVLFGVDLALDAGQTLALMGRNGMGKTTLLKTLMGLLRPSFGRICLEDREIHTLAPHEIARLGIAYVPQGREIFADFTVEENLLLGVLGHPRMPKGLRASLFDWFPILEQRRHQPAGTLSGGEQQQLAIARALASRPRLLLLDEPSEGIQPSLVEQLGETLAVIAAQERLTVLLVEQNLDLALEVADRVTFLENGRIVAEETAEVLRADATLLDRHLGL
jgi:branched-chain amino acid transport system ATP-binding protein/urea transport system ATP-binding protein